MRLVLLTLDEAFEARATHRFWRDPEFRANVIEIIRFWLSDQVSGYEVLNGREADECHWLY